MFIDIIFFYTLLCLSCILYISYVIKNILNLTEMMSFACLSSIMHEYSIILLCSCLSSYLMCFKGLDLDVFFFVVHAFIWQNKKGKKKSKLGLKLGLLWWGLRINGKQTNQSIPHYWESNEQYYQLNQLNHKSFRFCSNRILVHICK